MSICLSCSVSFRFFLFIDGGCIGTNLQLWVLCLPRGRDRDRGRGSGDRNLTHCWPHDKRWLVNKSKAKANVSSLSLSVCSCCVSCCSSSSLQNVRKFLFATCNSLWQGLSRCLGPSGQVACNMIGYCTQLSAAAQHSTGYSYFICPVDL